MNFTFGIITDGSADERVHRIIDSIEAQNIPNYEVAVVGPNKIDRDKTKTAFFSENWKPAWITKKKNLITQLAIYSNVVYLHDYFMFTEGWYEGQLKAGEDYSVRMDKIINVDGTRFRDWCLWPHNGNEMDEVSHNCLLPYDITHLSKYMYISGGYWIAKLDVMQEFPLDERLSWGEGEDVLWSKAVREKYDFNMNIHSTVQLIKAGKDKIFNEVEPEIEKRLRTIL